jgi:hypothetical protein
MAGTLARCINLRKSPVSVQLCGISVSGVIRAVAICLSRTCLWLVRGERAPAPFPYIILLFEFVANDWPLAPMLLSAGECSPFSPAIDLERLARHVATHDPPLRRLSLLSAAPTPPRWWPCSSSARPQRQRGSALRLHGDPVSRLSVCQHMIACECEVYLDLDDRQ